MSLKGFHETTALLLALNNRLGVLVNLAPRALRGVESQGMILMTESPDGKLVFVNPDDEHDVSNGLKIS